MHSTEAEAERSQDERSGFGSDPDRAGDGDCRTARTTTPAARARLAEKVGRGERLDDLDIAFLEQVLDDAQALRPFLEAHPAYQTLAARTFALYKDIVARAAENEAAARG